MNKIHILIGVTGRGADSYEQIVCAYWDYSDALYHLNKIRDWYQKESENIDEKNKPNHLFSVDKPHEFTVIFIGDDIMHPFHNMFHISENILTYRIESNYIFGNLKEYMAVDKYSDY